jgi:hypothetical protein
MYLFLEVCKIYHWAAQSDRAARRKQLSSRADSLRFAGDLCENSVPRELECEDDTMFCRDAASIAQAGAPRRIVDVPRHRGRLTFFASIDRHGLCKIACTVRWICTVCHVRDGVMRPRASALPDLCWPVDFEHGAMESPSPPLLFTDSRKADRNLVLFWLNRSSLVMFRETQP